MAEDDQRIGVAPILDHYPLSRRILADKELIVRQLAEPDHRGRLDCPGAKPAVTLNGDEAVAGAIYKGNLPSREDRRLLC